jgi:hypothetical protein
MVAIEEALLVRELVQGLGLSQHAVARRSGHDVRRPCPGRPWPRASCANGLTITEGWPPHPRTQAIAESASVVLRT